MANLALFVKIATQVIEVHLPPDCTLQQLKEAIEERTGILTRKQKLLCNGKVLNALPANTTLASAGLTTGVKLMLLTSATESQGLIALRDSQKSNATALQTRRNERATAEGPSGKLRGATLPTRTSLAARLQVWKRTGIAALRDLKLLEVPIEVTEAGGSIRVADLGGNKLVSLPLEISSLNNLQKLRLSMNELNDAGMRWNALVSLQKLVVLVVDSNNLTALPESISQLTTLQKLSVDSNALTSLPESIGCLTSLRSLSVRSNKLVAFPASLCDCVLLEELAASRNPIKRVPPEIGNRLRHLKLLLLDNTLITEIPTEILTQCESLSTLSLRGCPITAEALRETSGFDKFEERRRRKYDKKIDMKVLLGEGGFDEGADVNEWEHWKDG